MGDSVDVTRKSRPKALRRTLRFIRTVFSPPKAFAPDIEKKFLSIYARQFAAHRRAAAILAVLTWLAYVHWDFFHKAQNPQFREVFPYVLSLRMLGLAFLIAVVFKMKKDTYLDDRKASVLLSTMVVASYVIMLIMVYFVTKFSVLYYIGLLLILFFLYGLLRLRAKYVIINSVICLAVSLTAIPFLKSNFESGTGLSTSYYFTSAMSYLVSFMVIGTAVAVQLERAAREGFVRELRLKTVRLDLASANAALLEAGMETAAKTRALMAAKDGVREAVEQQNRDKSRFLASAAHDLRQPMQALSNLLEASAHSIERGDVDGGTRMLAMAREAAALSRSTFNAVLDISRLESGFVEANYSNFDISELLDEVAAGHGVQASFADVTIRRRKSRKAEPILVHSDRHLLSRIISNLISNAIKYADPANTKPKTVIVAAVPFSNRVRVDVLDNGIGISRSEWENIFKPFVQLQNSERDRSKGVGLGLSIVQASVALMAGHRLDMTSTPGKGTRFSIELPLAHEGARVAAPIREGAVNDASDLDGVYVLYVEDDPMVRQSTLPIFEAHRMRFEAFASVEELEAGLELFEMTPDVIVTDYRLPLNKTAEDVVRIAREALDTDIPVVVITGEVGLSSREGWQVLHKPVAPHTLLAAISRCLPLKHEAPE